MQEIAGLPFWEIHFDKTGKLLKHVGAIPAQITDLFVFAHPWNNDYNDAKDMYDVFFEGLAEELVEHGAKHDVHIGLAGVFWPSMLWPGDEPLLERTGTPLFGPVERDWAEELKTAYNGADERAAIDKMRDLIKHRPSHPDAIAQFKMLLGVLAPEGAAEFDDLSQLAAGDSVPEAGFPDAQSRVWQGAEEAIRLTAYTEMARRALVVGERGLGAWLQTMPDTARAHLLGHSFGAGLVGAAACGGATKISSLFVMGVEGDGSECPAGLHLKPVFDTHPDLLDIEVARAALRTASVV